MTSGGQDCGISDTGVARAPGLAERFAREMLLKRLAGVSFGRLTLEDEGSRLEYGDPGADLRATVRVRDPGFYSGTAFGGSIGAAEAYMDGLWECDDLVSLVRILLRNLDAMDSLEGGAARLTAPLRRWLHRRNDNSRRGSRRNIAAHYDLGNEFYRLFLDPTMAYSCGIFHRRESTLEEASVAKFDRICRKLGLSPGMELLEIGTGWGGFALHAAREYGCRVTTTTISARQHDLAAERFREAGLEGRITLLRQDYRDLRGSFDRLVSIEMIEAVGDRYLPAFFRVCGERLKADGMALVQAITVPDRIYDRYVKTPDFISHYIFPGGCCPSLAAMSRAAASATDLRLTGLEDLTPHYASTLREWRSAFRVNLPAVRALGYHERFVRMWDYYLAYCEGGFAEQYNGLLQLLYAKPDCRIGPGFGEGK
jgi:cyclopropane-fatty-acyl-phospholipid synthase